MKIIINLIKKLTSCWISENINIESLIKETAEGINTKHPLIFQNK